MLNQLFGKGKEPFWQQAYTNLVRWIIELHRVFPERWVTLQQVYRCAIDPELFAAKIEEAEKLMGSPHWGSDQIGCVATLAGGDRRWGTQT